MLHHFYRFLLVFPLISYAWASDKVSLPDLANGELWEFEAETRGSQGSSTEQLNGRYKVYYKEGKLEVTQLIGEQELQAPEFARKEIERMIVPDERMYLKKSFAVGDKWESDYTHVSTRGRRSQRQMSYEVKGVEQLKIADRSLKVWRIEGDATLSARSGVYTQKRIILYSPEAKSIVDFFYDSAVGDQGAKVSIKFVKFSSGSGKIG